MTISSKYASFSNRVKNTFRRKRNLMKEKGDRFEERVTNLLHNQMKFNIKRNVILKDKYGNISEIDVVYGFFRKTYIECKNYTTPVPLKDVAKFKEVLQLNGISIKRGLFITNSTYAPRALTIGIKCVDGTQLKSMERWSPFVGGAKFAIIVSLSIVGFGLVTQTSIN